MKRNFVRGALLAAAMGVSGAGQAALHDRGSGLIYDDVLDITWLQDANLAATNTFGLPYNTNLGNHPTDSYGASYNETISSDGRMTWGAALHWIDAMNTADYLGYSNWRLPTVRPVNGSSFVYANFTHGEYDMGYNISAPGSTYEGSTASELAYMYYQNLGNPGKYDLASPQSNLSGCYVSLSDNCLDNVGPFVNLQPRTYWFGTESAWVDPDGFPTNYNAWTFDMVDGKQGALGWKVANFYAWAVLDGDVAAPVPEPETYVLMLAGLGLVGFAARRRRG